jgi:hypothetical protein
MGKKNRWHPDEFSARNFSTPRPLLPVPLGEIFLRLQDAYVWESIAKLCRPRLDWIRQVQKVVVPGDNNLSTGCNRKIDVTRVIWVNRVIKHSRDGRDMSRKAKVQL